MRLTANEQAAIRVSASEAFGADAVVRVFGSRLDDRRRGGDIDLHVQVEKLQDDLAASACFRALLNKRVGEREYDIVIAVGDRPLSSVDQKALAEGVRL